MRPVAALELVISDVKNSARVWVRDLQNRYVPPNTSHARVDLAVRLRMI